MHQLKTPHASKNPKTDAYSHTIIKPSIILGMAPGAGKAN